MNLKYDDIVVLLFDCMCVATIFVPYVSGFWAWFFYVESIVSKERDEGSPERRCSMELKEDIRSALYIQGLLF
jgi:hypothetical protein